MPSPKDKMLIKFRQKNYNIKLENLINVIKLLSQDETLTLNNKEEIDKYMKKYKLYDTTFLSNINKL